MKITRRHIRKLLLKEMYHQLYNAGTGKRKSYHQVSDATKSMAMAAKRRFAKDYPEVKVGIDSREGWLTVNGKKAVNISSASGKPMQIEDMVDKMKQSYLGHPMAEGVLSVSRSPYGMSVEDDTGEYITIGEMVLALLQAGDDDIFQAPQGVDPDALARLNQKHEEGVQGGMQRWDSDVFEQYYSVDNDRVVRLYAKLMNHSIEEVPYDEY